MKLYNTSGGIVVEAEGKYYRIEADWVEFINDDRLFEKLKMIVQESEAGAGARIAKDLLSVAVGPQEVWQAGSPTTTVRWPGRRNPPSGRGDLL